MHTLYHFVILLLFVIHIWYNVCMTEESLSWQALEYEHKPKTTDWFWILGAVVFLGAGLAFYFNNFFFAVFILIAGLAIALHANIPPTLHSYNIREDGLVRDNLLFPFRNIKGYSIIKNYSGNILLLNIKRVSFPILTIPLSNVDKDWVRQVFHAKGIKEVELEIPFAERLMDVFGF